jgi:pyridoxal phosphate enzyme (YggS family)
MSEIQQHILDIRKQLPEDVNLLCVSKFQSIEDIRAAYEAGERDFGESRVQELVEKHRQLPADIRWHFIGHLQTNKVKQIVPFIHLIHSVDSERLLEVIDKEAEKAGRQVNVLIEVHVAREQTKTGFAADEVPNDFSSYPHVCVMGVMGMATNTDDEVEIRRCFRSIAAIGKSLPVEKPVISMGMSGDYYVAVEEGATFVRVGTSIFGNREYKRVQG